MAVIPTTDVNLATKVRNVLNSAGGSVSDILSTFFSSSAKLNMWSKYKPVVAPEEFLDTDKRWKDKDGKCGLTINQYNPSTFMSAAKAGTTGWSYTPPTGESGQPRRLGDFRGYCTDAYNPLGAVVTNGIISNGKVTFSIDVAITGTSSTNLTLNDIEINDVSLSNYYMGVFVWNSSSSFFYTSSSRIGSSSDLTVSIPITTAGTYNYIPFLSSVAQTSTSAVSATIISCNKKAQEVKIVTSGSLIKVIPSGAWNAGGTAVENITATLVNTTSASVTFTGIKVQLRYGSTGASSSLITTASYSGSVTVAANSQKTVDIPNISNSYSQSRTYWLAGYADITTETVYNQVDENSPE